MIDTDCYAVPGENHIIATINAETGLTRICGHTEAEVLAREPGAVRMAFGDFLSAMAERQETPIVWVETTAKTYHDMLEVLPPAFWQGGLFLVGEPTDHSARTGQSRFQAYREDAGARYFASSRPLTIAEAKKELGR